jgi:hypothetical protein
LYSQSLDFAFPNVGPDYVKQTTIATGIALKKAQMRERHLSCRGLLFPVDSIGVFCKADPFDLTAGDKSARVPASIAFLLAIKEIKKQVILNQVLMKLFCTVNDKTLKIPLAMSFRDIPHCGILPLRVQVLFKYSLRTIALQCLRPWPFIP